METQMHIWKVRVVRSITQSGVVTVHTDSAENAVAFAIEKFSDLGDGGFSVTETELHRASATGVERIEPL